MKQESIAELGKKEIGSVAGGLTMSEALKSLMALLDKLKNVKR